MTAQIKDIMTKNVLTIGAGETLTRALELMRDRRIRHLPVLDSQKNIVGILTDRDFSSLEVLGGLRVEHVMSTPVHFIDQGTSLRSAIFRMLENQISSLLVSDDQNNAVGIVTTEDLLWQLAHLMKDDSSDEQKQSIWSHFDVMTIGQMINQIANIGI